MFIIHILLIGYKSKVFIRILPVALPKLQMVAIHGRPQSHFVQHQGSNTKFFWLAQNTQAGGVSATSVFAGEVVAARAAEAPTWRICTCNNAVMSLLKTRIYPGNSKMVDYLYDSTSVEK